MPNHLTRFRHAGLLARTLEAGSVGIRREDLLLDSAGLYTGYKDLKTARQVFHRDVNTMLNGGRIMRAEDGRLYAST